VSGPRDSEGEAGRRRLTELEKVVRAFLRDGRLVSIPAKPRKRELLLPVILDRCGWRSCTRTSRRYAGTWSMAGS
jgi:hypothetical protein